MFAFHFQGFKMTAAAPGVAPAFLEGTGKEFKGHILRDINIMCVIYYFFN